MDTGILILIIILSVIFGLLFLNFVFAAIVDAIAFGHRCDKNPLLKYFTAQDFNLEAKPVSTTLRKTVLRGYVYRAKTADSNGKLIIFCHGMGPGQIAYTTEIAYFCNRGYTVLAFDNMGCNMSGGKKIKSMYAGAEAAMAAVDFAQTDSQLKSLTPYLVGHSWGGYSALCASDMRKVAGVVAISAPDNQVYSVLDVMANGKPAFVVGLMGWFAICLVWVNLFKNGIKGTRLARNCAKENGTPTLLVCGDNDKVVTNKNSVYVLAESAYNITKFKAEGKGHNPYNTVEAEKKLAELNAALRRVKKMTERERFEFFGNFDYSAATEEDEAVMQEIVNFIER